MEKKGVKFLIFIILLALLGGAIYLIVQKNNTGSKTKKEKIETISSIQHFVNLTEGYDSKYNGIDRLFQEESATKDDLHNGILLTAAYRYILDPKNNIDSNITPIEYAELEEGVDISNATVLKGKQVRDAIKILFGIEFENDGYTNKNFKYAYSYDPVTDMYIRKESTNSADAAYSILPIVVSNKKNGSTIVSKVAIAYVIRKDKEFNIYSDSENTNLIKTVEIIDINDFTEKELDQMAKFNITSQDINKNYTFEKIEAVK